MTLNSKPGYGWFTWTAGVMTTQLCVRFTHFLDTGKLTKGLLLWAERHIDRQTDRQKQRHIERLRKRHTGKDRQTDGQRGRERIGQTDRQRNRDIKRD